MSATVFTKNSSRWQLSDGHRETTESFNGTSKGAFGVGSSGGHEDVLSADQVKHKYVVKLWKSKSLNNYWHEVILQPTEYKKMAVILTGLHNPVQENSILKFMGFGWN